MPMDLKRLLKRRASAPLTPSEEFVAGTDPDESLDLAGHNEPEQVSSETISDTPETVTELEAGNDFDSKYSEILSAYADSIESDNDPGESPDYSAFDVSRDDVLRDEDDNRLNEDLYAGNGGGVDIAVESGDHSSQETFNNEADNETDNEPEEEPDNEPDVETSSYKTESIETSPKPKFIPPTEPLLDETQLNQGFSQTMEAFAIEVMNVSDVSNISISAFGNVGAIYVPDRLSLLTLGDHKFIGYIMKSNLQRLFYFLNELVEKGRREGKARITINLTQQVLYRNVPYVSLVATEDELSTYSGVFGRTVYINPDETDVLKLKAVIECNP